MSKPTKLRISIQNWIELGGDVNKLVGETIYYHRSVSSTWFVHEVLVRTITRGKNKGRQSITLVLKYSKDNDYKWQIRKFTNYFIEAPIMLVPSKEVSLNNMESMLNKIKGFINEFNIDAIKLKYLS